MTISRFLPSGWTSSCLTEIAVAQGGGTPSRSDASFWTHGTVPWVSPKDMKSRVINSSEDLITERALAKLSLVPPQSVLIVVRSGILSRTLPVALNAVPVTINQDMRAFVPEVGVEARFVAWQLIWREGEILSACSKNGTTVASIEGPALARFPLHVAPTAEQTRIVEKLEELLSDLDAGVAELKAAQKKLALYRQSLLKAAVEGALTAYWRARRAARGESLETGADLLARILTERRARWEARQMAKFKEQGKTPPKGWQAKYPEPALPDTADLPTLPEGWVWASVSQLSEIQGGIQKQPSRTPKENKYPFLRVANVHRGNLKLDDVHEIELFEGELERLMLKPGDVLIVEGNGSLSEIGRCALWDGSLPEAVHQNHLIRVRPIGVQSAFMEAWLNSVRGIDRITTLAATTSGLYTLNISKISKVPVPVPPHEEQTLLLGLLRERIEDCNQQEAAVKFGLKQSAAQRKNLLKAAFSGQLVQQDPNDESASELLARIRVERETRVSGSTTRRPRKTSHA